ncbi:transmembrane-type terpene cyclase [Jiulongibacter sediminis]|uniref:Uncharacterized protein n=1 Tax=Jiulongibacter sediminis TaxID=1605367 RepID=A0A0P7C0U1_9BACT|nr:hypothetical protein [Jiulongibacter sediminis]KPM47627.1 hypothetical protein AFM12_14145 [Jiulongibacter sediminis]TBX23418.1 hypothetical protein TK44_14155 [Jiulongibacter sediminis]
MNQPLINFELYPVSGLLFNGIGCLFWVVAYVVLVWEIRKKKFVEMPAYVAGANIGWEFVWSFIYHPDTGLLYALSYIAAFFLDCYIFWATLKYGTKQPMNEDAKKHFVLFCLINFGFWILFTYFHRTEGYDTTIGANSGYIINVILSLQCLFLLFQTKDTSKFSLLLAWSRMLGTGLISVSMFIFYADNHFVQLLGVACFILDCTFIYVLKKRHGTWLGLKKSPAHA